MKKSILTSLEFLPYFTIEAIKQLLGDDLVAAGTIRTMLYRWMKAGHVIQLKRGVYMTRKFYEQRRSDPDFSLATSAIMIPQSYVSLEFILQRYAILTEITYPVSAITLKQTRVFENKLGTFVYRNIKDDLYCGFTMSEYSGIPFSQATEAKALFDYFYLRPRGGMDKPSVYGLAEDLRLNLEDFSKDNQREFAEYVALSKSRKMDRVLKNLRNTVWQP